MARKIKIPDTLQVRQGQVDQKTGQAIYIPWTFETFLVEQCVVNMGLDWQRAGDYEKVMQGARLIAAYKNRNDQNEMFLSGRDWEALRDFIKGFKGWPMSILPQITSYLIAVVSAEEVDHDVDEQASL